MKVVELSEDYNKAHGMFLILSACALQGKPAATLESARNLVKLQDAVESISEEKTVQNGDERVTVRVLKEGTTTLVLNDGPYELLKTRFFDAEIAWLPQSTKMVIETYDQVLAAKEVRPEDIKS